MRRFALTTTIGLVASLLLVGAARAQIDTGYHWPRREITVVDAVGLGAPLDRAAASWSASLVHLTIVSGKGGCRFQRDVIRLCDVRANDVAAWTQWKVDPAGHFIAVRVTINTVYAAFRGADPGFVEYVLCHELGHALGLGHDRGDSGCMDEPVPWPSASDLDDLARLYGHADP